MSGHAALLHHLRPARVAALRCWQCRPVCHARPLFRLQSHAFSTKVSSRPMWGAVGQHANIVLVWFSDAVMRVRACGSKACVWLQPILCSELFGRYGAVLETASCSHACVRQPTSPSLRADRNLDEFESGPGGRGGSTPERVWSTRVVL